MISVCKVTFAFFCWNNARLEIDLSYKRKVSIRINLLHNWSVAFIIELGIQAIYYQTNTWFVQFISYFITYKNCKKVIFWTEMIICSEMRNSLPKFFCNCYCNIFLIWLLIWNKRGIVALTFKILLHLFMNTHAETKCRTMPRKLEEAKVSL